MSALQPMQQHTVFWRMLSKTHGLFQILSHARICFQEGFHKWHSWDGPKKEVSTPISIWTRRCRSHVPNLKFPPPALDLLQLLKVFKNCPVTPCIFPMPIYIYIYIYKGMLTYTNGVISEIPWIAKTCWLPTTFSYICYTLHSLCNALD